MDLNKAMIIGRLTRDPEIRTIPSGQTVASFSVATNLSWTDQSGQRQEKVEFHNIVAWRKLADICGQYLKKGKKVYIEGRLQTRDWVGQDNIKRYRTEIIATNMIMLDRAENSQFGQNQSNYKSPQNQNIESNSEPVIEVPDDSKNQQTGKQQSDDEINVEDIPF
ncbi:MAG: single-stranded DNA-binding protein [Xanthomonadaceae bacterium]|nr:single-stranded DNA-binding protein [Rhodospirillaceae bacterium]NIA18143.1 single-stranded DNA-binding protein [Xanthomonadaceae bacterium]